ncbi:MAG: hypothetical protein HKN21_05875 [Candidatus Eisenbacteria bacterium]|uniref:LamG domain-containing protein n=1 Tax=Eiseniibacteriota bacterium TaxID=2212470 RepID=A0A7Y2EDZ7_UNCEI|nr:hypothetical protein [Candidatus Eisenbacteria bacterium]
MRALRYRGTVLLVLALVLVSAAWATNEVLVDYSGFDWFWPADIGQAGSCYAAVGYVNSFNPTYVNFDFSTYEYTFDFDYACFVSADTFGTTVIYTYDGSTSSFDVYCDSLATGTAADYGTNPPNAVAPSTWTDGECILGASWVGDITIVVDTSTGAGDISGILQWDSGTQLANIPPSQRENSLSIAGILFNPPNGPEGYHWQIDGFTCIQSPVAVEPTSWGRLKQGIQGDN